MGNIRSVEEKIDSTWNNGGQEDNSDGEETNGGRNKEGPTQF